MARIRTIKVDLFVDDSLADVSVEAHLLLAGLPCIADSAGRLEDRPKRIHALLMPYRPSFDVSARLDELQAVGAVLRYEVGGVRYLQVANWDRDQRPHVKEAESTIPAPPPGYTEHRKGGELAGNSPGTRPSEPAGNREYGLGVLDLGSGVSSAGASAPQAPNAPRKSRASPGKPTDPRHAPLREALVALGYPFRGGRDAKAVTQLLALADQREESRGDLAAEEVLRRARIGWEWVGFPACRSLSELHSNWGHYERSQGAPQQDWLETGAHEPPERRLCARCGIRDGPYSYAEKPLCAGCRGALEAVLDEEGLTDFEQQQARARQWIAQNQEAA